MKKPAALVIVSSNLAVGTNVNIVDVDIDVDDVDNDNNNDAVARRSIALSVNLGYKLC